MTSIPKKYTREDKERFALCWILHGTVLGAAKAAGIPRKTAEGWMRKAWWDQLVEVVRIRHKDQIEAKLEKILDISTDALIDRLENGNTQFFKGSLYKVPVPAKELAGVIDTSHKNLRTSRNQPNNVSVVATMDLRQLASNFARAGRTYQLELNGRTSPDRLPLFEQKGDPSDDIDEVELELPEDNEDTGGVSQG